MKRPNISAPILFIVLLLLTCFALGAAQRAGRTSAFTVPGGSNTPAEAVRRAACGAEAVPTEFEVYETYASESQFGRYVTVLFRAQCPSSPGAPRGIEFASWVDVRRDWFSWRLLSDDSALQHSRSISRNLLTESSGLLGFAIGQGEGIAGGPFAYAQIQVLAPGKVDAVEITSENGNVVRRRISDHTATILLAMDAEAVCEVRALDASGRVLQRFDTDEYLPPDQHRACTGAQG